MNELYSRINEILAEWDPIGVGKDIADLEYIGYIPSVIRHSRSEAELMMYLKHLLVNELGLEYNENRHYADVKSVCRKIINTRKKASY